MKKLFFSSNRFVFQNAEIPDKTQGETPKRENKANGEYLKTVKDRAQNLVKTAEQSLHIELGTRDKPKVTPREGQTDISNAPGFRDFNEHILTMAKRNMTDRKEYGDTSEITVDNTSFILGKQNGIAYVQVCVIGEQSGAIIQQIVPIQMKEEDEIVYNRPPLTDGDVDTVDPEVKKLA